ncbi:MAG: N-acetyltransferase [Chloroflexota bacterium]|nr:MAG: N-acetyltransferase [Chloroflexota bacterium]
MLQGKIVALRAVEKEDVESIREWLTDVELIHALGARPIPLATIDPEKLPEVFRLREGRVLSIVGRDRNLIGILGFGNVHEFNRSASLVVLIGDRGEWNRGYASDAIRAAVRFGFEELNLNSIEALIPAFNARALRVFQKAGFAVEGTLRERFFAKGKYWDMISTAAIRGQWTPDQAVEQTVPVSESATTPARADGVPV